MEGKSPLGRLSVMMFLQYAVWGAWLPLASLYFRQSVATGGLGFSDGDIGAILGIAASIGAVASPFVAGQFADRYFRTERFLAFLLFVGAAVQWKLRTTTTVHDWKIWGSVYSVLFMPTLALSNSLAFAHLDDRSNQFGKVRVWGSIGWIAASWAFPMIWMQTDLKFQSLPPFLVGTQVADATEQLSNMFTFSAMLSVVYALYAVTCLPATPPKRDAVERLAFAKAFRLFAKPSFLVLVVAGLAVAMIHQLYFFHAGPFLKSIGIEESKVGAAMTVGQFSEIALIACLGPVLSRLGFRTVLMLGGLAYFGRYWIWSMADITPTIAVASLLLHGACYAFFFAAAYIYVDRIAPPDVRHSAQTVFSIIMLGGGPILGGAVLNERLVHAHSIRVVEAGVEIEKLQFPPFFRALAWIGLGVALLMLVAFRDETKEQAA